MTEDTRLTSPLKKVNKISTYFREGKADAGHKQAADHAGRYGDQEEHSKADTGWRGLHDIELVRYSRVVKYSRGFPMIISQQST
jgi:hypothetical protein